MNRERMVRMEDIAREVGVSVSTVSRVLNETASISETTCARVRAAASRLGYVKIPLSQTSMERCDTAGIIIPDLISNYYMGILNSLTERFREKGLGTLFATSRFDPDEAISAVHRMMRRNVRCKVIVIDDCEVISRRLIEVVRNSGIPTVFITAAYIPEMDFDCLHMDEERGCSMAVEHLIHRGYTRIGCICEPLTLNRRDLFYKVMKRFNMPVYPELVSFGQERAERGGYLRMKELLSGRRLPDAVVACYDQMAIGALHAIQEAGLRIPQDIAVIGFDGIPASEFVYGGLTTISCPYDDMAGITVRILLRRMDGLTGQPQQVAVKPLLVVRATT